MSSSTRKNTDNHRTVCLSMANFQKLCDLGKVPDSMNQIVGRLIDQHYKELKRRNDFAGEAAIT
jgi:hypothetical protein